MKPDEYYEVVTCDLILDMAPENTHPQSADTWAEFAEAGQVGQSED